MLLKSLGTQGIGGIYNFGNDFYFQNEEFILEFNWTGGFLRM